MRTKKIFRAIFFIGLSALILSFADYSSAIMTGDGADQGDQPVVSNPALPSGANTAQGGEYTPGEVLVKFKEGADPQAVLQEANLQSENIERIHSIKPAAERFRKDYKLDKDSGSGWYSFLGRNYKEVSDIPDEEAFKEAYKAMPEVEKALYRSYKVKLPEGVSVEEAIAKLKDNPDIEYAEPNGIVKVQMLPNDPYYSSRESWGQPYDDLWGVKRIQCEQAWDISQGEGVVVAVIDTGVDYNHPDLAQNIWTNQDEISGNGIDDDVNGYIDDVYGWNFCVNSNNSTDFFGHGTHCAGTIAGTGNNGIGVIGVAPKAKIMPVKGIGDEGEGSDSDLANCVRYAADNGANILSNSWGGEGDSQLLTDAFHYAYSKGCVCIAAAGNSNDDVSGFSPANIDTVIAVAATTEDDKRCDFSNFGIKIDVSAPGGGYGNELGGGLSDEYNILSTMPDNSYIGNNVPKSKVSGGYWRLAGTSMACPHAAGVAALIFSRYHSLTNDQVRSVLQSSADDLGEPEQDKYLGSGRVNALRACSIGPVSISIDSPAMNSFVKGTVFITGTVYMKNDFARYELYYAPKNNPEKTTLIISSTTPVENGILGAWDSTRYSEGEYVITLKGINSRGTEIKRSVKLFIDNINEPPAFNLTNKAVVLGKRLEFKVAAKDPDDPLTPWGCLRYSASDLPPGAQFDPMTQVFSWQPSGADKGTREVTFTVRDNENVVTMRMRISTVFIETSLISNMSRTVPAIYGDKIVLGDIGLISLYDIKTKNTIAIPVPGYRGYVSFYGNRLVWLDAGDGSSNSVRMHDLLTGRQTLLAPFSGITRYRNPRIYKDRVVWQQYGGGTNTVIMHDLLSNQEMIVGNPSYEKSDPAIYEDKIVYKYYAKNETMPFRNHHIGMYNLTTGEETRITKNYDTYAYAPSIFGNHIIWHNFKKPNKPSMKNAEIWIYEIETQTEKRIADTWFGDGIVALYGDKGAWNTTIDVKNNNSDIFVYDIAMDQTIQITYAGQWTYNGPPDIYEDKVVWGRVTYDSGIALYETYLARIFFSPIITSITPLLTQPGAIITITGNNFGYTKGDGRVEFSGGAQGIINSWSNTEIRCVVPKGAVDGPVKVVTKAGASNGVYIDTNSPPVFAVLNDRAIDAGKLLSFSILASDPDGDKLTYSVTPLPQGAVFSSSTGVFTWGPVHSQIGTYKLTFTVSDGKLSASQTITITVNGKNAQPTTGSIYPVNSSRKVDARVTFTTTYSDTDGYNDIDCALFAITDSKLVYLKYSQTENRLYMQNGSAWIGGFTPGSPNVIENAYAKVYCSKTKASGSRNTLRIRWRIKFKAAFSSANQKAVYMAVSDKPSNNAGCWGWVYKGTFTVENIRPDAPSNLSAVTISSTQIRLSWKDNSDNEDGFRIERAAGSVSGTYVQVATPGANITSYMDTALKPGKTYYYRILAYNSVGTSRYSTKIPGKTK